MATRDGKLYVGTSNVVVPGNKSTFPERFRNKSRLNYYSSLFNSVELNSTFYKIPMPTTFQKWADDVPEKFRFSIKLWKEITHAKELKFREKDVELFLKNASFVGNKKGCLLLQFPGKITFSYFNQVAALLETITQSEYTKGWTIAAEFRNADWYIGETFELLQEHNATLVLHDIVKGKNNIPLKYSRTIYQRFHGPTGDYRGSYSNAFLKQCNKDIQSWLQKGNDVYAYFNNTIGNAFDNAIAIKKIAGE